MAMFNCFSTLLVGKKKKKSNSKESPRAAAVAKKVNSNGSVQVEPEEFVYQSVEEGKNEGSLGVLVPPFTEGKSPCQKTKVAGAGEERRSMRTEPFAEVAYDGGDEQDDISSMKRDFSDFDLQARAESKFEQNSRDFIGPDNGGVVEEEGITPEIKIQSGHLSDPGIGRKMDLLGSPQLKRSCSNIETKRVNKLLGSPTKTNSYDDLHNLVNKGMPIGIYGSPLSVKTWCSADKVMLKKRSSSQVLPSRSRKLWWKLFLWSHRNLHRPQTAKPQITVSLNAAIANKKGGYTSDTIEASPTHLIDKKNKKVMTEPQNYQWVAFSAEASNLDRVNAWVNSLEDCSFGPNEDEGDGEAARAVFYTNSTEIGESSGKNHPHSGGGGRRMVDEDLQANNIIQSLNTFSSVAHISGMGLKVIPTISAFTSLRTVNLSGNFIVHISPGSLPKGLHALDLSRNKIGTIEGLRELTRLRVLNLSYNRISRIGQGLSNCTVIKELYLAGNKISEVEGLHRLLKLAVLDLSFNKMTTAKVLGQLVANYHSLLALNLLGNPIQSNIGDDQLRKAVSGLLPHLAYLNKQPIKPQRAREVATDSVAKAALGINDWSSRRKLARRVTPGSGPSSRSWAREGSSSLQRGSGHKNGKHRSKSRHQSSSTKIKVATVLGARAHHRPRSHPQSDLSHRGKVSD